VLDAAVVEVEAVTVAHQAQQNRNKQIRISD